MPLILVSFFVTAHFYRKKSNAQILKLSIKDFFSKFGQIRRKLRIWSHLLKKSLMENFTFCAVKRETFC